MTKTVILDSNIYDAVAADSATAALISMLVAERKIKILVTRTIAEELYLSPFKGIPEFFPVEYMGNTVGRLDVMTCGDAIGEGAVFEAHLGRSSQINDALIADAADWYAHWLVTNDTKLKTKMDRTSQRCKAMTFAEFVEVLKLERESQ